MAKYVVYRTNKLCRNRYKYIKILNDIQLKHLFDEKLEGKNYSYMSNDFINIYKSLIPEEEEILFQQIANHLNNNELVTADFVKELALKISNSIKKKRYCFRGKN